MENTFFQASLLDIRQAVLLQYLSITLECPLEKVANHHVVKENRLRYKSFSFIVGIVDTLRNTLNFPPEKVT